MLFVDRAWPWQASLSWLLAIALAPVGVICWQWAYWWVLRRMGAQGPVLWRAFNWSLAPLWLGAPGLALFYLNDFTHHLLWHVALAKILAAYVIVGIMLALQVWVLDTAPALDRWPPLRLAMLFRQATPFRHSRESGNQLLESWSQVWQLLRVHAALVILLAAGLALRLRDLLLEGGERGALLFLRQHGLHEDSLPLLLPDPRPTLAAGPTGNVQFDHGPAFGARRTTSIGRRFSPSRFLPTPQTC